jgi:c-di-GMP-binding flagellar brake protein YcgR
MQLANRVLHCRLARFRPGHATGVSVERRATKRFRLKLPITVRWTNRSGIGEARTESEDISSRGVYFVLPEEIKKGSSAEFVLVLPHEITLAEPVRIRCQGRVQRTEMKGLNRVGIAAEIERYEFLRGKGDEERRLA